MSPISDGCGLANSLGPTGIVMAGMDPKGALLPQPIAFDIQRACEKNDFGKEYCKYVEAGCIMKTVINPWRPRFWQLQCESDFFLCVRVVDEKAPCLSKEVK
jgi:hypothetical protein